MESICEHGVNWRNGEIYNWSMADPKTFGERIAWLLRRRRTDGLPVSSQKELAAAMKISPQYLNALMNGRRAPNVQHLRAAANAWLRQVVRVFVKGNQVVSVEFKHW